MWDVYDANTDSSDSGENVDANYWDFFDAIGEVPEGYKFGETESPFVDSGGAVDAWDSFRADEFQVALHRRIPSNWTAYWANCMSSIAP